VDEEGEGGRREIVSEMSRNTELASISNCRPRMYGCCWLVFKTHAKGKDFSQVVNMSLAICTEGGQATAASMDAGWSCLFRYGFC